MEMTISVVMTRGWPEHAGGLDVGQSGQLRMVLLSCPTDAVVIHALKVQYVVSWPWLAARIPAKEYSSWTHYRLSVWCDIQNTSSTGTPPSQMISSGFCWMLSCRSEGEEGNCFCRWQSMPLKRVSPLEVHSFLADMHSFCHSFCQLRKFTLTVVFTCFSASLVYFAFHDLFGKRTFTHTSFLLCAISLNSEILSFHNRSGASWAMSASATLSSSQLNEVVRSICMISIFQFSLLRFGIWRASSLSISLVTVSHNFPAISRSCKLFKH